MSEAYNHNGITITPTGGGYYELTNDGFDAPIRARGKEEAEAKAEEFAKQLADGSFQQPGDSDDGESETETSLVVEDAEGKPVKPAKAKPAAKKSSTKPKPAAKAKPAASDNEDAETVTPNQPTKTPEYGKIGSEFTGTLDAKQRVRGVSYTRIILEEQPDIPPTGLFISHNFRPYMIQPGVEVDVPDFILTVLDNAISSAPMVDPNSKKVLGYRSRSKYPYRVVKT